MATTYFIETKKGKGQRLCVKRDSTGKMFALTGWANLNLPANNELLRMANLGRRVPLSRLYAMFPGLK